MSSERRGCSCGRIGCGCLSIAVLLIAALLLWVWSLTAVPTLNLPAHGAAPETMAAVDTWLQDLHNAKRFNGGVLLMRDGQPLLMKTYGFTDHTRQTPLTTQSSFQLASVSKQFTAAGILLLVERGLLDLDQPVAQCLDGFPYATVTPRHLLNQTSGIPDNYMQLAEQHRRQVGDVLSLTTAVELVIRYPATAAAAPGDAFEYSNTNYILLARLIEVISGQSFEQFMSRELFEPLGMVNTRVWNLLSDDATFENKTADFNGMLAESIDPSWLDGVTGDGAVYSSLEDFIIWDAFWRGNDLISKELLAQAFQKPKLNDGRLSDYGFGWVLTDGSAWHNGQWLGAATYISRGLQESYCLVILDNSSSLIVDGMAVELEKVLTFLDNRHHDN